MRIVHEIHSDAQVSGGFNPYTKRKGANKSKTTYVIPGAVVSRKNKQ